MVSLICLALSLLPTTLPASQPAIPDEIRRELSDLRREITYLRTENEGLRKKLALAIAANRAATKPVEAQSPQARNFKPGLYKIMHRDGRTWVEKHCDTLDDALRYARNMRWDLTVGYNADDGTPYYPGVIRIGD